jgi:hypothetical protein
VYELRYARRPFDEWIELLIEHPNAPIALLRRIARDREVDVTSGLPNDHYWNFLFERAQETNDPELRRILADTMPELSLDHLARQSDEINVEWPIIIRRLARTPRHRHNRYRLLATLLGNDEGERLRDMTDEEWAPLGEPPVSPYALRLLALVPSARRSDRILALMRTSHDPVVMFGLCLESSDAEARRLFRSVAKKDPALAGIALNRSTALRCALRRGDLLPLLRPENDEATREAAFHAMPFMQI